MAENQKRVEEDRRLRIKKDKDKNTLIKQDNQENMLDGKVVDVYDIVNRSSEPIVIKLRNLKRYNITDEMIKETYLESASSIETETSAINTLASVFKKLALYITYLPNGIVIDLTTGELDKKASYREAVRLGIISKESIESSGESKQKEMFKEFEEFLSKDELKEVAIQENAYIKKLVGNINDVYKDSEFNKFLEKDPDNFKKMSPEAKNVLKDVRKKLSNEDIKIAELYKIEIELDKARNTPRYDAILKEKQKFLRENPEYIKEAENIRYDDGKLKQSVVYKFDEINENLKVNCLLTEFAMFAEKDINSISPEERKGLITSALAGLRYNGTSSEGTIIKKECWKVLKAMCPELKEGKGFKDTLYAFVERELDLKEELTPIKFDNLIKICCESVNQSFDLEQFRQILNASKGKIKTNQKFVEYFNNNSSTLNFQKEIESFGKSDVEKYFYGSKIDFTQEDRDEFNSIYRDCTINSWIDNKKDALILQYASLVRIKEKLKENPSEYDKSTIEKIEKSLQELKEKYPNLQEKCEENGKLKDDVNEKAEEYQNNMIESALLKFYSVDIISENNGKGYKSLDSEHKKAYLRNLIVGLNYAKKNNNPSILKIAQRRLELLNSEDRNFISFDENGNAIVNEQEILDEYNSMAKHKWNTFEDLSKVSEARKDAYILKKLDEYEKLNENDFIKLDKSKDLLEQIEDIKAKSNQPKNDIENTNIKKKKESKSSENQSSKKTDDNVNNTGVKQKKTGFWNTIKSRIQNFFRPKLPVGVDSNEVANISRDKTNEPSDFEKYIKVNDFSGNIPPSKNLEKESQVTEQEKVTDDMEVGG